MQQKRELVEKKRVNLRNELHYEEQKVQRKEHEKRIREFVNLRKGSAVSALDSIKSRSGHRVIETPDNSLHIVVSKESTGAGVGDDRAALAVHHDIGDQTIYTEEMFREIKYVDPDGGVWKQGWPYDYDNSYDHPNQETLTIHVVPHSHNDPGWIKTYVCLFVARFKFSWTCQYCD